MGWEMKNTGPFDISEPKEKKFGDFSCNLAMIRASKLNTNPRELAEKLAKHIRRHDLFSLVSVDGPGFINMTVQPVHWVEALSQVLTAGESYGRIDIGQSKNVIVEFVSANPT